MKKAKRKAVKAKPVKIKKIALSPSAVLHVEVPPSIVPVVAVHTDKGVVEIVPVPKKKLTWWQWLNE